jgi:hypothetical protein
VRNIIQPDDNCINAAQYNTNFFLMPNSVANISYSSLQMGAPARADSRRRLLSVGDARAAWPALVAGATTGPHASENRYNAWNLYPES